MEGGGRGYCFLSIGSQLASPEAKEIDIPVVGWALSVHCGQANWE